MRISLVVAVADNGVIGREGGLPWHLPDDLKYFRSVTLGKPVLMGRHTFESIGRPLPGRRNIVMSRRPLSLQPGVEYVGSLQQACALLAPDAQPDADPTQELCVIGGAQVYELALPYAQCIQLTRVHATVPGDVYFPVGLDGAADGRAGWRETWRAEHDRDERHAYPMSFVRLERTCTEAAL